MDNLRTYFYYERDTKTNHPIKTVCLLVSPEDGSFAKGVALCSLKEMPVKAIGRRLAEGRARKIFNKGCTLGSPIDLQVTRRDAYRDIVFVSGMYRLATPITDLGYSMLITQNLLTEMDKKILTSIFPVQDLNITHNVNPA